MRQWTAMTMRQIIKHTKASAEPCATCQCFSVRIPDDGSPPFCVNDNCAKAWKPDATLLAGRPHLRVVDDA